MKILFRPLLDLQVKHGYYPDGHCPELEFIVPSQQPALKCGRLLTRVHNGRLVVLYEADADGHAIYNVAGESLLFGLTATAPGFTNFTAAPVPDGYLPLYANRTTPDSFAAPLFARILSTFPRVMPDSAERPVTLHWQKGAQLLAERTLAVGENEAQFDSRSWPHGCLTLTETANGFDFVSHWLHQPELAARPGLWGILLVTIDNGFYTAPPSLSVVLATRQERLRYYVVARKYGAAEFNHLNVNDAGAAEQNRLPLAFERIDKDDLPDDDFPDGPPVGEDEQVVLFQTTGSVDRRAGGYRKLQLRRNTEVLVQHLPQAGTDRAQARFVVHLAKS